MASSLGNAKKRRRESCNAKVKVQNGQIIGRLHTHEHTPDQTKIEVTKVRAEMKRRAEMTIDAPQRILSDGLAQASVEAAVNLPRIEHIRQPIRRFRAVAGDPVNPRDRANVPIILNEFQVTSNGDRFLLHDSGVGDADRMIIFGTDQCLDLLK